MDNLARRPALALVAGSLVAMGCSFGESGVTPPLDGIFLPTSVAVDPAGNWLFVVNSNSDLRYNAGTVAAIDLRKAADDRGRRDWTACSSAAFRPGGPSGTRFCCVDFHDPQVLNCDERGYVASGATVRVGSFGSGILIGGAGAGRHRLFVSVRAEPSVTFIDAVVGMAGAEMTCTAGGGANATCDDSHKIRSGSDSQGALKLPEEPFGMALDERLGVLYVSHGFYGLSVVDTCAPERPTLVSVVSSVFANPNQSMTGLMVEEPGNPASPVYALGRYLADRGFGAEVQALYLRGGEQPCGGGSPRALELVPGASFSPSAFYPSGIDIRGLVISPDKQRAYVLHRNGVGLSARDNPPAVVAVDRSPDAQGRPVNRAVEVVEICSGATELHWHDAGRGPRLHVVCFESGQIYVVDPTLMEVTAVVNAGRGPNNLAFAPQDRTVAYLAGFSDNNISVIDLKPGSPTEYKVIQRIGFPTLRR
jgi:DNA-binding beta-propeller fold protein YncE